MFSEYWDLIMNDKLVEAMDYARESGMDQFEIDMGSWFTCYPGRPDYFTHWGGAFKYAASVLGLPVGDYPAFAAAAGEASRGRPKPRSAPLTAGSGWSISRAASLLRKALPIGVQYVHTSSSKAASEEVRTGECRRPGALRVPRQRRCDADAESARADERRGAAASRQEFYALLDQAEADPAVRAIVVTGSGRAFCAGADMGDLTSIGEASTDGETDISKMVGERHPHFVSTLRKPVIAAINGACAGIGLTQALMCDVRFAAEGAKFTTSFARRGLIAEYGICWILPRVVGWGAAMDLLLSGRVFLADEAAELGLVKEVVAPEDLLPRAIALRRGHRRQLCAELAGGDQATGVRRRDARCLRGKRSRREADARVDVAARLHRGHHRILRKETAQLSAC